MDDLHLSDTLFRYFSDVFLCCDEDKSGKVSVTKAIELLKSGGVPEDVILQVMFDFYSNKHIYLITIKFEFSDIRYLLEPLL